MNAADPTHRPGIDPDTLLERAAEQIRQPLTGVLGYLDLLARDLEDLGAVLPPRRCLDGAKRNLADARRAALDIEKRLRVHLAEERGEVVA